MQQCRASHAEGLADALHTHLSRCVLQGGDLRDALWRDTKNGTHEFDWENKGQQVALAVARGLHFLHTSGVIHRCGTCMLVHDCLLGKVRHVAA